MSWEDTPQKPESGRSANPFHIGDDETVIVPLDHSFVKEGRFASLLIRDRELTESLAEGFQTPTAASPSAFSGTPFHLSNQRNTVVAGLPYAPERVELEA